MKTKKCKGCGKELPLTGFHKENLSKDGLKSKCKECRAKYNKQWCEDNKEQITERKKQYRIKNKEYIAKGKKQWMDQNPDWAKEYHKKYYAEHAEHLREKSKEWQASHKEYCAVKDKERRVINREQIAERKKQYRKETKENITKYGKQYYLKNKEYISSWNGQYYKRNKETIKKAANQWRKDNPEKRTIINGTRRTRKKQLPATLTSEQWEIIKKHFDNKCCYCGKESSLQQDHFVALSKGGEYTHNNIVPACSQCNAHKHNKDFFKWYPKYIYYSKKREKKILAFLGYSDTGFQQPMLLI